MDITVRVSSFQIDLGFSHGPENLLDTDPHTAWVGGGVGAGLGQWIEITFPKPVYLNKLGVFNGFQCGGEFEKHRRIRSGRIVYPDGNEDQFWLRDILGEQTIHCSGKRISSFRIVVDEVFPKAGMISKTKLAVSGLRFYVSDHPRVGDEKNIMPENGIDHAVTASHSVPVPLVRLLKEFYVRQASLAHDYAALFAQDVRDRNDFRFEVFKEIQRQRGTYSLLRSAQVETDHLNFEILQSYDELVSVRVFGVYHVTIKEKESALKEDSVFLVRKTSCGWKIVALEGEDSVF